MSLIEIEEATVRFDGVVALDRVSLEVEPDQVFAIVGPNGAGKSTVFNLISRFCEPAGGDVRFEGRSILRHPPATIAGLGIGRTFQNIELFENATVLDNVLAGRHTQRRAPVLSQVLFTRAVRDEERTHRAEAEAIIAQMGLSGERDRPIAGLPYGLRKRVEIARALATAPKLLLLDEPAAGLSAQETRDIAGQIGKMRARTGVTVMMVEHHMGLVGAVADRVLVLAEGRAIALGTPRQVQADAKVIEAYLGGTGP